MSGYWQTWVLRKALEAMPDELQKGWVGELDWTEQREPEQKAIEYTESIKERIRFFVGKMPTVDAKNEAQRELLKEKRVRLSWDADKRFLESYDQQYQVHGKLELWFKARLGRVGKAHYVEHFSHDNIHDLHSEALMTLSQVEDFFKNNDLTIPLEFDTIYDALIADRPLRMANRDLKRYWPGWRDGQTMYERTSRDVLSWDREIEILKALQAGLVPGLIVMDSEGLKPADWKARVNVLKTFFTAHPDTFNYTDYSVGLGGLLVGVTVLMALLRGFFRDKDWAPGFTLDYPGVKAKRLYGNVRVKALYGWMGDMPSKDEREATRVGYWTHPKEKHIFPYI